MYRLISPEEVLSRKIKQCKKYKEWRSLVLKRDKLSCEECGVPLDTSAGSSLKIYLKSFIELIKANNLQTVEDAIKCEELWDLNNGVVLCGYCYDNLKTGGLN